MLTKTSIMHLEILECLQASIVHIIKNRRDLNEIPEPGSWTQQPAYPLPLQSLDPNRCEVEVVSCSFEATPRFYVRFRGDLWNGFQVGEGDKRRSIPVVIDILKWDLTH